MPYSIGQWTGVAVTAIVVLGCDLDILYAMPLGIMAAALATLFVTLAEALAATGKSYDEIVPVRDIRASAASTRPSRFFAR